MGANTNTSQIVPRTKAAKRETFDLPLIPPSGRGPGRRPGRSAAAGCRAPGGLGGGGYHMPSWVPSMEPNPLNLTRSDGQDDPDEAEDGGDGAGVTELCLVETDVVHVHRQHPGRVAGAALGQDVDDVEIRQRTDQDERRRCDDAVAQLR